MFIKTIETHSITIELTADDCMALAAACQTYSSELDRPQDSDRATAARAAAGFFTTAFIASEFHHRLPEPARAAAIAAINQAGHTVSVV